MEQGKKKRFKKLWKAGWWILVMPLLAALPSWAEEKIQMEEVVVTATRHEEKLTDVPANVTSISEADIKASTAQNIPDLLRTGVGILVNDINGNRRTFTVDLRGFGETAPLNTLVLVDGRRVNQADLSGVDWTEIPLERLSRIEIIRGGRGSVLYGDNATGGVINIITKEAAEGFRGGVDFAGGSYNTIKSGAYASGGSKDYSLHLSGNYFTSDGYRDNSRAIAKDLGANAVYYVKDFMKIDFSSGYHWENDRLPGALKESDFAAGASRTDSKFPNDFSETEDYYLKIAPEVYFSGENVLRLDASFRRRDFLSASSGDWGSFLGDSGIKTTSLSPQVILKNNLAGTRNILTAGFDYQKTDNNIVNTSVFLGFPSVGVFSLKRDSYGYYLHDEVTVTERLRLSGGYRYDSAKFSFAPSTSDSISMSRNLYTAGVNYTVFGKSYVYASYSKGFRYPVLDELYSFFTNTINTSLVPQTTDNYEVGLRHYISDDFFAHLNVFRLDTDREIFFNPVTYQNENLDGKTRRDGIEISFNAKAASWLSLKGGYTFLSAKIKAGMFEGKNVPNAPKNKATVQAISHLGKGAEVILSGVYIGERPFISDFSNDFSNQKGYFLMNAKFAYKWKSLRAFLDINNLTNKEYSEFGVIGGIPLEKAYYPSPKRNFLLGLSLDF
jgi:iron complex outermembrane receptor protein